MTEVKRKISWPRVLFQIHIHVFTLVGFYILATEASLITVLFSAVLCMLGLLGVTAGAHRLWAHHAYEANTPLKICLMLAHTLVGQGTLYDWAVKHRVHHKYFGTSKDPFDRNQGFFYSHLTSQLLQDEPLTKEEMKELEIEDLDNDAIIQFQKNFYWLLMPIVCWLLPVNAPMEYWGDTTMSAIFVAGFLRYAIIMHLSFLVNSAIHIWGLKPEDKYPADTMLVFILTKSHWLMYHYLLPWDYQCSEFGGYGQGFTTTFLRVMSAIGWAGNLRTVDSESVKQALYTSVTTGVPVDQCVQDILSNKDISSKQTFLAPAKFL